MGLSLPSAGARATTGEASCGKPGFSCFSLPGMPYSLPFTLLPVWAFQQYRFHLCLLWGLHVGEAGAAWPADLAGVCDRPRGRPARRAARVLTRAQLWVSRCGHLKASMWLTQPNSKREMAVSITGNLIPLVNTSR